MLHKAHANAELLDGQRNYLADHALEKSAPLWKCTSGDTAIMRGRGSCGCEMKEMRVTAGEAAKV
jgi:hypothetical protein